jgi:hypothetical protein
VQEEEKKAWGEEEETKEEEKQNKTANFSLANSPDQSHQGQSSDELLELTASGDWEAAEALISQMRCNRHAHTRGNSRRVRSQLALLNQEEKALRERLAQVVAQKKTQQKLLESSVRDGDPDSVEEGGESLDSIGEEWGRSVHIENKEGTTGDGDAER